MVVRCVPTYPLQTETGSKGGAGEGGSGQTTQMIIIIASASDGNLYLWNMRQSDLPVFAAAAGGEVTGMRLSAEGGGVGGGQRLVTVHSDKTLALWSVSFQAPSIKEIIRAKPKIRVCVCLPSVLANSLCWRTPYREKLCACVCICV